MKTRKEVLGEEVKLGLDTIQSQVKFLQGKVLTVIEASIMDKDQLRAVKNIINNDFSNQLMYILQLCYPKTQMLTTDQAESIIDPSVHAGENLGG